MCLIVSLGIADGLGARCYHGLPIIVTTNDYLLGLFNGDTGLLWANSEGLRAYFPRPEHGDRALRHRSDCLASGVGHSR